MICWDESIREKPIRTAIKSPQVWGLLFGAAFLFIGVPLEYLGADDGKQELSQLVIGLSCACVATVWAAYNFNSIRYMIVNGVYVEAEVDTTGTFSVFKFSRLVLRYVFLDREINRIVNCVHPSLLQALKENGACEILVDPRRPKRIILVTKI